MFIFFSRCVFLKQEVENELGERALTGALEGNVGHHLGCLISQNVRVSE